MPETLKDSLTLLENTKLWSLNNTNKDRRALDIKYSALRQDDADGGSKPNGNVGQEVFDNVNFDYDDFSDEDDAVLINNDAS